MTDWSSFLESVEPTHRVSRGNRLTHLRDDDRAIDAIWKTIEDAKERVWVSIYMLAPDRLGLGTIDRLAEASRRGCDVCLLYDYLGSINLRAHHPAPLLQAGGRCAAFNRFWPPWKKNGALRVRNHRKLIIVDAAAALCGGLNLCDDYVAAYGESWVFDDTVVMLEGPAVFDLMEVFQRTWHEVTGTTVELPRRAGPLKGGVPVQVLETDPRRPETRLRKMLDQAISRAERRCVIATPYFMPADWFVESLLEARARGADVEIMTAGRTDLPVVRGAARKAAGPLLEAGVRVYEMYGRMLHSKSVSIDGQFGTIGSYNLDRWTARHTLDVSIAVVSEAIAHSLEDEFDVFLESASEYTLDRYRKRGVPTRILHWSAEKIADAV